MRSKFTFSILVLFVLTLPLTATSPLEIKYSGIEKQPVQAPQVVKVYFDDENQLNQLAARYDIWEVDHESGYLLAYLSPKEILDIDRAGWRVEVDKDLNSMLHQPRPLLPNQVSGIPGYPCYRTVEETTSDLAQLSIDYPDLVSFIDIGDSWEKSTSAGASGYDLHTLILTNKNSPGPKPKFYIIAAVHAREYATAEIAAGYAEYLLASYDKDPDVTWLLDYFEVHITPYGNPDGRKIAENGIFWRKNIDNNDGCSHSSLWGTDLNRNSSFKWGGIGASPNACDETYRGVSAASEPEIQAIQNYAASIFPDQRSPADSDPAPIDATGVFITLHSYGEMVLFPWGWTSNPSPNDGALETLGRKFGYFTGYQVCPSGGVGCLYQTSGSNDDWVYGELGVAAYTFELGIQFFESCSYFEDSILDKNIDALLYAFKSARRPYQNPAGPELINLSLSAENIAPGASLLISTTADDTRYDSAGWGVEPVQSINAARYSIDQPSWIAGTQTYPLSAVDGSLDSPVEAFSASIDTSSLSSGRHPIFIESQDADGNWGVPSAIFFWITSVNFEPELFPTVIIGSGPPGTSASYIVQVTNNGTMDDYFDLQLSGNSWEIEPSLKSIGPIAPQATQDIWIYVSIPDSAQIGDQDMAILKVVSNGDPTRYAISQITTTVRPPELYLPTVVK